MTSKVTKSPIVCNGMFLKNCKNMVVSGFELCTECNKLRLKKIESRICSASQECSNLPHGTHSWCHKCYASKKIAEIFYQHNCSDRGGVACSTCDDLAFQASKWMKILNSKKYTKPKHLEPEA